MARGKAMKENAIPKIRGRRGLKRKSSSLESDSLGIKHFFELSTIKVESVTVESKNIKVQNTPPLSEIDNIPGSPRAKVLKVEQSSPEIKQETVDMSANQVMTPPSPVCSTVGSMSSLSTRMLDFKPAQCLPPGFNGTNPMVDGTWTEKTKLWSGLMERELRANRRRSHTNIVTYHPVFSTRARAILFGWLLEVCEVYHLHRETYYLAIDYIDRFLSVHKHWDHRRLQLLGTTCLFMAAKIEEIYPPKCAEFAYITDGACTESQVKECEMLVSNTLHFWLTPISPIVWLAYFMQCADMRNLWSPAVLPAVCPAPPHHLTTSTTSHHLFPSRVVSKQFDIRQCSFPKELFMQAAQLLDLCSLDVAFVGLPYSWLAAAALYHFTTPRTVEAASGLHLAQILPAVQWMAPYAAVVCSRPWRVPAAVAKMAEDDHHNVQYHTATVDMLEQAHKYRQPDVSRDEGRDEGSQGRTTPPGPHHLSLGIITPPKSGTKTDSGAAFF